MLEKITNLVSGAQVASAVVTNKSFTDTLILEILNNEWGSGDTRKKKLIAAGYDYDAVQARVNEVTAKMKTRKQALKPWYDACVAQHEWSYNAKYNWSKWSPRTIAKSKDYGTCITYPNAVAMRCGLIKEPAIRIITSSGSNHDSQSTLESFYKNSVKAMNSINPKYWSNVKFPNKTLGTLVKTGVVKEGDIIGFMGHTTLYAGKDSKGNLLFNNAGHAAGIYDNNLPGSERAVLNQKCKYANKKVYGVFSVNTFFVLTSCSGGTITASNRYMAGQNAVIKITPAAGKVVSSIKVDGKTVKATNSYTISKIDADHIIEVTCATAPVVEKKTIDELAQEVLANKWGTKDERKEKLTAAGYDYDAVQARVNEILSAEKQVYSGVLPTTKLVKTNAEVIADTIIWAKWIAGDNRFHYGYTSADKKANAHHNGCYFCGTQKLKKNMLMPEFTYCCNPFVGAAFAHGGCVPAALKKCQNTSSWSFQAKNSAGYYYGSPLFDNLGHPKKSALKPGDVLCRDTHVALYIGDGKIVQAGGGDDNVKNSTKWNKSISITTLTDKNYSNFPRVHRFNGKVNTTTVIRHGEVSDRVSQWQSFLDWYYDGQVGKADRIFGDNTLKWTKKFQEEVIGKGQGDGLVGSITLEAAAKVKK